METADERWMRRAIALARNGYGRVSPNPAVGCVIVSAGGKIIGEGWHRRYGEGHAEVNAVASAGDAEALRDATVYVTLEPCSHYGKTPPCAKLLAESPVRRIVVGSGDPNPRVNGRGIEMLRGVGKEVVSGVLEKECMALNPVFLTAQMLHRPYITLKWACGADGCMGSSHGPRMIFSTPEGTVWAHRERAMHDAVMVGRRTALADNPQLDLRRWPGRNPRPIVIGGDGSPDARLRLASCSDTLWLPHTHSLGDMLEMLWKEHHISSLLVEGGARLLEAFLENGLYDRLRRETNPRMCGGDIQAPAFPADTCVADTFSAGANIIEIRARNDNSVLKKD